MRESNERVVVIDPDDPLTHQILEVCDRVGVFIEYWGFRAIHGRVWALLALTDQPLAQIDIASLLGVSRALVHGAVTELEGWGLVRRRGTHRRAPVEAEMDVWPVIMSVLRSREWVMLESVRLSLDAAMVSAQLHQRRTGEEPFSIARLQELAQLTKLAQGFLKALLSLPESGEARGVRGLLRSATGLLQRARRRG